MLWDEKQQKAARVYGEVFDLPFPKIDASADENYIEELATEYFNKILALSEKQPVIVHLMGEMTFCFVLIRKLQQAGIECIASTSKRNVQEMESGQKQVKFTFVRFRKYTL
jgi:hypothetical protein